MASRIVFVADDLRIIGHAVNWQLNGPFEHSSRLRISEGDKQVLRILFNELCQQLQVYLFKATPIVVEIREPYTCADGQMQLPMSYFRLLADVVACFLREMQHSPVELEIVTSLPLHNTSELLSRMEAISAD